MPTSPQSQIVTCKTDMASKGKDNSHANARTVLQGRVYPAVGVRMYWCGRLKILKQNQDEGEWV